MCYDVAKSPNSTSERKCIWQLVNENNSEWGKTEQFSPVKVSIDKGRKQKQFKKNNQPDTAKAFCSICIPYQMYCEVRGLFTCHFCNPGGQECHFSWQIQVDPLECLNTKFQDSKQRFWICLMHKFQRF